MDSLTEWKSGSAVDHSCRADSQHSVLFPLQNRPENVLNCRSHDIRSSTVQVPELHSILSFAPLAVERRLFSQDIPSLEPEKYGQTRRTITTP